MYTLFKKKQDAFEIGLLKQYIKPGDAVLDIGANIGFYTEIMSGLVGKNGIVHAFEPDATNFRHLQDRTKHLSNTRINSKAVADKPQTLKIYTSKQLNVDHRTYKPDDYDAEIDIEAIAMDDYLMGSEVSFIKMDIQGFEMNAVKGMIRTLARGNVKMLSEFWPYGMRKAGSSALEYYQFLKNAGFFVYLLKDEALKELSEDQVRSMLDLPENHYMNILASKSRVAA